MTMTPHKDPRDLDFPGDASPQRVHGLMDSLRSIGIWGIGIPHLTWWALFTQLGTRCCGSRRIDKAIKQMTRQVTLLAGVRVHVRGRDNVNPDEPYVFVVNHVNIFDMFAIYQAIPQYTRGLEHISHFRWPVFGAFIRAAGQIPVDPDDSRVTARGLRTACDMLKNGESLVVLPEGSRTLDGTVGPFYPGAFRLAIKAGVPVMPMAIHGGRSVSRRGDWRVRPGIMRVVFGHAISTAGMTLADTNDLADHSRNEIISLLQCENRRLKR